MSLDFINKMNIWVFFIATILTLLAVAYSSYTWGRKSKSILKAVPSDAVSNYIHGLLALILGFSFSMALTRFDLRRELAIRESNAIDRAYLRLELVNFKNPSAVKELFKKYLDLRIEAYKSQTPREVLKEVSQTRKEIWRHFIPVTVKGRGELESDFLESLNDMFDSANARNFALMKMLPPSFYLLILILAATAFGLMNFDRGFNADTSHWRSIIFILLFGVVFSFIYDMDHFRTGLIQITQDSLSMLRQSM